MKSIELGARGSEKWGEVEEVNDVIIGDISMSYFAGLLTTQYHKSRAGYYINHDLLMSGIILNKHSNSWHPQQIDLLLHRRKCSTKTYWRRQRWVPSGKVGIKKIRDSRIGYPISFWTYAAFFGVFGPNVYSVIKRRRTTAIRDIAIWAIVGGFLATAVNSTLWRTN